MRKILDALVWLAVGSGIGMAPISVSAQTEHRVACPSELGAESIVLPKAPPGWTASARSRVTLHSVDLSWGPPEELAFLTPEDVPGEKEKGSLQWTDLAIRPVGKVDKGIWVACNYGKSDTLVLGKRLDNRVSSCKVMYTKNTKNSFGIDLRCTW